MLDGYWERMGRGNKNRCLLLISSDSGPPSKRQLFALPNLQLLQKFDMAAHHPANEERTECVTTKIRVHCRLNGKNWWIQERLQACALIQLPKIMVIEIISKGTSVRFARDLMNQRLNRPVVKSSKIFHHEEAGKGIPHSG